MSKSIQNSKPPSMNPSKVQRLRDIVHESIRRRGEALRLFRPMPDQMPILEALSTASEFLVRGGQRSGKTVLTAAITASAATRIPLCDCDGNELPHYFPTDRPLLIWVFGYDERHISVIHRKLFRPGLFRIIEDEDTGEWRAWDPSRPEDMAREKETKPSPPMIPPRMIPEKDGWSWRERAGRVFELCRLKNGTEIHAFPSGAEAPTGEAVDVVFIDEALKYASHIPELQARLSDNRGKLLWSSWPKQSNTALMDMSTRAAEQKEEVRIGKRKIADVVEICLQFNRNKFIPKEEARKRIEAWSDAERRARDLGEWVMDLVLVYPEFNTEIHCTSGTGCPEKIRKILAENNQRPPWDWTHYLALDPGHTQPAVLFAAVPPTELGDFVVIYDEVYIANSNQETTAREIARIGGSIQFETFIIDNRYGRQHQGGSIVDITQQYSNAFRRHGLKSKQTEYGFVGGCDNIDARIMLVRECFREREDGTTKLLFVKERVPNTIKEFSLYKKMIDREGVKEKIADRHHDAMDCMGYIVAHNPVYVRPDKQKIINSDPIAKIFTEMMERKKKKLGQSNTVLMGAGTPSTQSPASVF